MFGSEINITQYIIMLFYKLCKILLYLSIKQNFILEHISQQTFKSVFTSQTTDKFPNKVTFVCLRSV